MSDRDVRLVRASQPTLEGAGVHLRRAFGFGETRAVRPVPHAGRLPRRRSVAVSSRASRGTRIAGSRPSPTCIEGEVDHGDSHGQLRAPSAPATCSG